MDSEDEEGTQQSLTELHSVPMDGNSNFKLNNY